MIGAISFSNCLPSGSALVGAVLLVATIPKRIRIRRPIRKRSSAYHGLCCQVSLRVEGLPWQAAGSGQAKS
jgi:hypothetical protein